jgi:hypothetical protein
VIAFFFLLLIAGLTSSISLVEAFVSGMQDKFRIRRSKTLLVAVPFGMVGSVLFALPVIVNSQLGNNGVFGTHAARPHRPLGLWLRPADRRDSWSASCSAGSLAPKRLRAAHQRDTVASSLGAWFDVLIAFVIPAADPRYSRVERHGTTS